MQRKIKCSFTASDVADPEVASQTSIQTAVREAPNQQLGENEKVSAEKSQFFSTSEGQPLFKATIKLSESRIF